MNPTKVLYNIKKRIEGEIGSSLTGEDNAFLNLDKTANVKSVENYHRLVEGYIADRRKGVPLKEIKKGKEFMLNVDMINKQLHAHDEFNEAMKRRLKQMLDGEEIEQNQLNPLMT